MARNDREKNEAIRQAASAQTRNAALEKVAEAARSFGDLREGMGSRELAVRDALAELDALRG